MAELVLLQAEWGDGFGRLWDRAGSQVQHSTDWGLQNYRSDRSKARHE